MFNEAFVDISYRKKLLYSVRNHYGPLQNAGLIYVLRDQGLGSGFGHSFSHKQQLSIEGNNSSGVKNLFLSLFVCVLILYNPVL